MTYFGRAMRIYSTTDGDLYHEWFHTKKSLQAQKTCPTCKFPWHSIVPQWVPDEDAGVCLCPRPVSESE